jgi:hypothetical protein
MSEAQIVLKLEVVRHSKYVFHYNGRPCYKCKICNCGPWYSPSVIEEHFKIFGPDEEEHLERYREFLESCKKEDKN